MTDELYAPTGPEVARGMAVLPESELLRVMMGAAAELGWRTHTNPAAWADAISKTLNLAEPSVLFAFVTAYTEDIERPDHSNVSEDAHADFVAHHREYVEMLTALGFEVDKFLDIERINIDGFNPEEDDEDGS